MLGNMKKLQQMQKEMKEIKDRLETVSVTGESQDGSVKVICNANKKVLDVSIDETLAQSGDKSKLEDMVLIAVQNAMEKAENVSESEMQQAAMGMMNMPGLFK